VSVALFIVAEMADRETGNTDSPHGISHPRQELHVRSNY
jgi:hypothetical protein